MWVDDETRMSDQSDKSVEEKMAETSEISIDDNGEMMDVEFGRDDTLAKSEGEGGSNPTNKEAPLYAVRRFTIKTESNRNVNEEGLPPGTLIHIPTYSSEAADSVPLRRVGRDPNDEICRMHTLSSLNRIRARLNQVRSICAQKIISR